MHFSDTRVQTRVAQTAQQSGVSLPERARREEGLSPSQLLRRQQDVLAELRQQSVRRREEGNTSAAEVRDGGLNTLGPALVR